MTFRSALLAATIVALPLAAKAQQPVTGLYVGAGAGINIMQNESIKSINAFGLNLNGGDLAAKTHIGPAVVASVGYGLGNGLRLEVEGSYRYNPLSGLDSGNPGSNLGGKEQKYGAMLNVLYDFNGLTPMFVPYVGVGAGYQWTQINNPHGNGNFGPFPSTFAGSTHREGSIAYQAILGAAVPVPAIPGLAFTAEYRFMGLTDNRDYPVLVRSGALASRGNVRFDENFNHSVLLGVRYNFGQAPAPVAAPAPAPAPAAAPARSYLVFFDWDKATLTDRARQIVSEAASNSTRVQYTRIEVNGYTDTSGTPRYNQGLSVRRAQAVAAELVKDGVPRNAISIQGFGDTHLLVPTGPGVREPQNRRVEIIIR